MSRTTAAKATTTTTNAVGDVTSRTFGNVFMYFLCWFGYKKQTINLHAKNIQTHIYKETYLKVTASKNT